MDIDSPFPALKIDMPMLSSTITVGSVGQHIAGPPARAPFTSNLRAAFPTRPDRLLGTAGFGFWNAPFGDPTVPYPALPQAVWFFFGSKPNDLPLNLTGGAGRGFFASTLDATTWAAISMAPAAPLVVLLNRMPRFKRSVWPKIQNRLGISYRDASHIDLTAWHRYEIVWGGAGVGLLY